MEATTQNEETQPRRFRPYPEYKDSGIEWLGEIPAHWEVKRLKFVTQTVAGQSPPSAAVTDGMNGLPFLQGNAEFGPLHPTPHQVCDSAPKRAKPGDILLSVRAPVGATNIADQPYGIGRGLCAIRPAAWIDRSFCFYDVMGVRPVLNAVITGSTYDAVTASNVADLPMLLPYKSEQRAIAAFLDSETAKIDALVARKERLIELLQEKRTALITRAVTRGLDPNVPMKDSGIEWLGEIPAHWEVRRIAMAVNKITNGYVGPTRDILVDDGVPYLQSLHIKNGQIEFDRKHYFVTKYWSDQHRKSILLEGDVLVVQTGDIGQNCVVPAAFEGTNCHALIILRLKPHFGEGAFLSYLLQSSYGQNALKWSQTGALHPHLECGHLREIPIVLPPPEEQSRIVRAVEEQTKALDSLQSKVHSAVDHLKELRTALISAAVSGKINVRKEVA